MKFVLLMAAREMRASWRRLLFFFVCIAIGVGAIVALRSVIQSVRNTFAGEARSLIAADAIVASNQALKPEVIAEDRRSACRRPAPRACARSSWRRWRGRPIAPMAARGWWSCAPSSGAFRTTAR